MNRVIIILFTTLLTSCAHQTLKKGLPYLVGQPINAAINALGFPNSEMDVAGYTIYTWDNRY